MSVLILVVDDEQDAEALFRQQFWRGTRAGRFEPAFAISAAQALSIIEAIRDRDILLLLPDINMPGTSGLDRVKGLRPDLPAIMITSTTAYAAASDQLSGRAPDRWPPLRCWLNRSMAIRLPTSICTVRAMARSVRNWTCAEEGRDRSVEELMRDGLV